MKFNWNCHKNLNKSFLKFKTNWKLQKCYILVAVHLVTTKSLQSQTQPAAILSTSCNCTDRVSVPICGVPVVGVGDVIQFDNHCALIVYNCNNPLSSQYLNKHSRYLYIQIQPINVFI